MGLLSVKYFSDFIFVVYKNICLETFIDMLK